MFINAVKIGGIISNFVILQLHTKITNTEVPLFDTYHYFEKTQSYTKIAFIQLH